MITRRAVAVAVALLPAASCATWEGDAFERVRRYVAAAGAAFDALIPLVAQFHPHLAERLEHARAQIDEYIRAFLALERPDTGAPLAERIIELISAALREIAGIELPPAVTTAIAAIQVLLAAIGAFFVIPVPATTMAAALRAHISAREAEREAEAFAGRY